MEKSKRTGYTAGRDTCMHTCICANVHYIDRLTVHCYLLVSAAGCVFFAFRFSFFFAALLLAAAAAAPLASACSDNNTAVTVVTASPACNLILQVIHACVASPWVDYIVPPHVLLDQAVSVSSHFNSIYAISYVQDLNQGIWVCSLVPAQKKATVRPKA